MSNECDVCGREFNILDSLVRVYVFDGTNPVFEGFRHDYDCDVDYD